MCLTLIMRNKLLSAKNIAYLTKITNLHNFEICRQFKLEGLRICGLQNYSTGSHKNDVTVPESSSGEVTTVFETVKKNTKTAWYGTIVIIGIGLTAGILYELFKELFSGKSPNNVYTQAFDRCVKDEKVVFALGEPVKGFGEENHRGRRQHVSHLIYEKDGVNYMRMKFYLKGSRKTATVHLEMKENDKGTYEYRYLFLQVDGYPHTTIILEDNRFQTALKPLPSLSDSNKLLQ